MTCRHFLKNFSVEIFKEDSCFGNPNIYFPILANIEGQNNKWEIFGETIRSVFRTQLNIYDGAF